jgi:hypothetical protein
MEALPIVCTQLNHSMSEPIFKLSRVLGAPVSDEELIADLRRVAKLLGTENVTQGQYLKHGEHSDSTQGTRFGGWNNALLKSGLTISKRMNISDVDLFENLLVLW